LLIKIGVILSTIGSSSSKSSEIEDSLQFAIGLGVLVLTLILSCFMGQYQQITYAKYGKHWKEGLFYNHFLGLPPFLLFYNDLSTQFVDYNKSPPMQIPLFIPGQLVDIISSFRIPQLWLFLCVNVCTQCNLLLM
jgi:UDP-xylose/UDP-N-acetylglucosamine transporter B4